MNEELIQVLVGMLNKALQMEHAASIQYATHSEIITGLYAEPLIARLKDSQHDEERHADTLREIISDYFKSIPSMEKDGTRKAFNTRDILLANHTSETEAIVQYIAILTAFEDHKKDLAPIYEKIHNAIRLILIEEQEHAAELERLM